MLMGGWDTLYIGPTAYSEKAILKRSESSSTNERRFHPHDMRYALIEVDLKYALFVDR
jgi:hypothetical protein